MNPLRISQLWTTDTDDGRCMLISESRLSLSEHKLSEVGTVIWELCDGAHSVDDIVGEIVRRCEDSAPSFAEVLDDVTGFLVSLKAEGLIRWENADDTVDVLFVVPPFPTTYTPDAIDTPEYSSPPLGVCYIAAVLRQHGFRVAVADLHISAGQPEDVVAECRRRKPKIVGITSTTPTYPSAVRVARFVKAFDPTITTVYGGAHATGLTEECARSGSFDFVCVGEGEQPMLEFCEAAIRGQGDPFAVAQFAHIRPNGQFVFRRRGELANVNGTQSTTMTPYRPALEKLDVLPMPARDLLDIPRYFKKGAIISTRGCPIDCNFCACAAIVGRTYRAHGVDYVLDEVEHVMKTYGCRFFDFHDDTFNLIKSRVFEFCDAVKRRKLKFEWGCFCRAAQLTREMACAMEEAGCRVVQFGVEAGNDDMLKAIKKSTTVAQIEEAVIAASEAGIPQIVCGFIIGHADDTEESVRETINFGLRLRELGATRLTLSLLTPYPGTEVYLRRKELGIDLLTTDWEQYIFSRVVMETRNLKKDRLRELYVEGLCKFLAASEVPVGVAD